MLLARWRSSVSSSCVSSRPVNTTIGISRSRSSRWISVSSSKPVDVGQLQIEDHAVELALAQQLERARAAVGGGDPDVRGADQLGDAHLFGRIVFDHQQLAHARLR